MEYPQEQVDELKRLFSNVSYAEEGGFHYFLIENLQLPDGCQPGRSDVLLCPQLREGYQSRLYFPTQVSATKQLNWNGNTFILDRQWFAYSWRLQQNDLRLAQMVASHLKGLS